MPPKQKDLEEVTTIRNNILSVALDILMAEGYASLSMRKIATRLGMSATNIYNYYENKDEVYLYLLIKGFELLYNDVYIASKFADNPKEKLIQVIKAIINFGITNPNYYELMLSVHAPKCSDYIGKPQEPIVHKEKIIAFMFYDYFTDCVSKCLPEETRENYDTCRIITMKLFSQVHGALNFYNNTILHQLFEYPMQVVDYIFESIKKDIENNIF